MRSILRLILIVLAVGALAGCSLFIEGLDEGRPCKDGRCPHTFVCIDDRCVVGELPVTDSPCSDDAECTCAAGNGMCDAEGICRCLTLGSRLEGVGPTESKGRFDLAGSSLMTVQCVTGDETYAICGGLAR
jgi:hypothetical protein